MPFTYEYQVVREASWNRLTIPIGSIVCQTGDNTYAFLGLNVMVPYENLRSFGMIKMTPQLITLAYQWAHNLAPTDEIWFHFFYHKQKRDSELFLQPPTPVGTKFVPDGRTQLGNGLYQLPSEPEYFVGYCRSTHPTRAHNRVDKYAQSAF